MAAEHTQLRTQTQQRNAALLVAAAVSFVLFVLLGLLVSHRAPSALDVAVGTALLGRGRPLAIGFTEGGLFPAYAVFGVASLVLGYMRRELLPRAIVAIVALIIAWQLTDLFKVLYDRPRPSHWFWIHETSWSYPSGHAVNAFTFWGIWAGALLAARPSAWRTFGLIAIVLWALGIGWSRMALGAHYLSDVVGGYLLGATFALVATVAVRWLQPAIE